jgi:hypothetical protein
VNGSDPIQARKLSVWKAKAKEAQSSNSSNQTGHAQGNDEHSPNSDDAISQNRFREQDELR